MTYQELAEQSACYARRIMDLENALRAMLVATDPGLPESFPGHSRAYLEQVARPRAFKVLEEIK